MKKIMKFSIYLLFFIYCLSTKSVFALSKVDLPNCYSYPIIQRVATGDTIYSRPEKSDTKTAGSSIDDVINDANKFTDKADIKYDKKDLKNVSNTVYNILFIVGVVIAVIMGAVLGIKLMLSGIEQKAEVKKLLVPYVAGCIIIFGGFGIWKLAVTILQGI